MEPTNLMQESLNQTNKKQSIVAPPISLPNRKFATSKDTPTDFPATNIPPLSPNNLKWYGNTTSGSPALIPRPAPLATDTQAFNMRAQSSQNMPLPQITGSYRWEEQVSHYPTELMQRVQTETGELQALVAKSCPPPQQQQKNWRKKRRVPEMRQVTNVECGAACIAMILNYYGYATSISAVQEHCGVGRDGLSALDLVNAAHLYGLRVRTVSLNLEEFPFVVLPVIVHWEFNHFLIVERWSESRVDVVDPAQGRRRLTPAEFDAGFTGIVLMLEPGAQFKHQKPQQELTLWSYIRSFLSMRKIIVQVIGTSLLLQLLGLAAPFLTEVVIDTILPAKSTYILTMLALGMFLLVLMQGITTFLRSSLLIYLQTRIDVNMMLNFFEHLLSLPYRFFQLRLNGDLMARMNSNLAIRDLFTNQLLSTLLDGGSVIIYFIILFILSKLFAEVALVIGVIQVALLLFTAPLLRRLTQRDLAAQGKTQGYMNEILSGIATVKAAGAEQRVFTRWENLFFEEMNISLRLNYLSSSINTLLTILNIFTPLFLLWIGATQVINGTMTIGTMLAFSTLAIEFLVPLGSLATSGHELQIIDAHFSRITDVIGSKPEQDPTQVKKPHQLTGQIELRQVSFQYHKTAPMILKNINAKILPRQKVALVGRTGSGKSTLGKLLVGLITPTHGSILFDGIPLEDLNYQEVRRQFGVVMQDSFIFSGSIKDNIALNNPDMDMQRIIEASQLAAIVEDIENMPMGYDTLVSEGGSAFSGGQRQRLALARALANHPALLLLDEATSSLDVVTEQTIEQNLRKLPCTQIIIAHRLSTIRNADVILVLDQGQIVEQGTHAQLLHSNGFYARLLQAQLQNGEIVAV